jgi:APA family basic amino acid/polyamine antiporter
MSKVRHETWVAFLIWGTIGILVYFAYSRNASNLNKESSEADA